MNIDDDFERVKSELEKNERELKEVIEDIEAAGRAIEEYQNEAVTGPDAELVRMKGKVERLHEQAQSQLEEVKLALDMLEGIDGELE